MIFYSWIALGQSDPTARNETNPIARSGSDRTPRSGSDRTPRSGSDRTPLGLSDRTGRSGSDRTPLGLSDRTGRSGSDRTVPSQVGRTFRGGSPRATGVPVAMGISDDRGRAMKAGEETLRSGRAAVVIIEAVRPGMAAQTLAPCYVRAGAGWVGQLTPGGEVTWDRFFP
jgi:hypothetical protein